MSKKQFWAPFASALSAIYITFSVGCSKPAEPRLTEVDRNRSGLDSEAFVAGLKSSAQPTGEPSRLLAAMIDRPEATYFIKVMAPVPQVAEVAEGFQAIVQSLKYEQQGLQWTIPEGWKEAKGGAQFRIATITAPNGTEVAITSLSAGQDLMSNLNRWQGQLGLPVLQDEGSAIERIEVGGQEVILYDQVGTGSNSSMMPTAPFASSQSATTTPTNPASTTPSDKPSSTPTLPFTLPNLDETWQRLEATDSKVARWEKVSEAGTINLELLRFPVGPDFSSMAGVWASSIGVMQPTAEQFSNSVESIKIGDQEASWITLPNTQIARAADAKEPFLSIRVARIDVGDDAWYFKWVGPTTEVEQTQEQSKAFLSKVEFND